jgi:lysophospholipase L1-like esterase
MVRVQPETLALIRTPEYSERIIFDQLSRMNLKSTGRIIAISALLGFALACPVDRFLGGPACGTSSPCIDGWRGHLRRLDGASAEGRVVFLGSSTFQGLDVSAVTPIGLNLSIGGDTLDGLSTRAASYRSLATARAVVVNIGLNDLFRDCALPAARIETLFAQIPVGTPIVLLGIQDVQMSNESRRCGGAISSLIIEFNRTLMNSCRDRSACQFVPSPVFFGMAQDAGEPLQEADGIHLSARGYQLLRLALRHALPDVEPAL